MSASFTWKIRTVKREPTTGTITWCRWECKGTDGPHEEIADGGYYFGEPDMDNFIPFENVVEENVLNWMWADPEWRGKEKMEAFVAEQVALKVNPPVVEGTPWETEDEESTDE